MMNIVTVKAIHPAGKAEIQVSPTEMVILDTFLLIFNENGTEKGAMVGCRQEHTKAVDKALRKRLIPLKTNEKKINGGE